MAPVETRGRFRRSFSAGFDRALDHGLLQHSLVVRDHTGAPVRGGPFIIDGEGGWRFEPALAWQPGRYELQVESRLEDVAGNSVARIFDRDLTRDRAGPTLGGVVAVPFECA